MRVLSFSLGSIFVFLFYFHELLPVELPSGFRKIENSPLIAVHLKYATNDNFMRENLYGDFHECYLHQEAAEKLEAAANFLSESRRGWKLLLFDCLRPHEVQKRMWDRVKGTPQQSYVANPERGSIHNFGFAVDLSLLDEQGNEVDMGTPYDSFSRLSQPRYEDRYIKEGKLTNKQIKNRLVLRKAMTQAGFIQLQNEWWHYDAKPPAEVRSNYKMPKIY